MTDDKEKEVTSANSEESSDDITGASLAENSVVIAFRDWQWQNHKAHVFNSSSFVSLAGKAEAKLGDGIVGIGDRLFILEVKSARDKISSEWKNSNLGVPKKNAFRILKNDLITLGEELEKSEHPEILESLFHSVAGHYFLYWANLPGKNLPHGELVVEPYLLAINHDGGFEPKPASEKGSGDTNSHQSAADKNLLCGIRAVAKRLKLGITKQHSPYETNLTYRASQILDLYAMYDGSAVVIESTKSADSESNYWSPIGLMLDDFKAYVARLCGNKHHQINVILTDVAGNIFAHITNTRDLLIFSNTLSIRKREDQTSDKLSEAQYSMRYPLEKINDQKISP